MTQTQIDNYLIHVRLEEINKKLRTGDIFPPEDRRSPSPEPTYDIMGKRTNSRDMRYRQKLEHERAKLMEEIIRNNPNFKLPTEFKRPGKCVDKVWIPANEYPEINFIGLLIGPRGNTLKKMENETGAKISIRGKGSLKEGKPNDANALAAADEELHAYVVGDTEEKVNRAVVVINKIIETACSTPEAENELKRLQLMELAALNGQLSQEDNVVCANCGAVGHRKFDCTERRNVTNNTICKICSQPGHLDRDCIHRNNPEMLAQSRQRAENLNSDYAHLMAQVGMSSATPSASSSAYGSNAQQQRPAQYHGGNYYSASLLTLFI